MQCPGVFRQGIAGFSQRRTGRLPRTEAGPAAEGRDPDADGVSCPDVGQAFSTTFSQLSTLFRNIS
jgi:hypothetical protein